MTTVNNPADQQAATDETGHQPPSSDPRTAAADATEADRPAAESAAAVEAVETPPAAATAPQPPESRPTAESPPESPPADTPAADVPSSAVPAEEPVAPRKVRLNPTVAPEVARPIPSLRPTPPAVAVAAASTEATPAEGSGTADPSPDVGDEAEVDEAVATEAAQQSAVSDADAAPPPSAEPVALPGKDQSLDTDLEAELEAAMVGDQQQAEAIAEVTPSEGEAAAAPLTPDADVKRGTRLKGIVASIHGDDMFIDFGLRLPGILSRRQFGLRKQPMQGEPLEVIANRIDEKEGLIHVNLPTGTSKVRGEWDALSVDQNVECMVTGTNKGGLEVSIGALRGFMPASQVDLGFVPDLSVYVGQKLNARIAEVNPKRRKLVLSRRALLEEEREQSQGELFEKIEPGQQYTGRVRTLKDYGAFVDIGGADGLLHVAQISWSRINHPSEVLTEGEQIEVQVLSVDKEKKKISLGMRQLTQNPWKAAESKFAQGTQIKGTVTRLENFGAFVELGDGVEGLVHISELDHKRVNKVGDVLRVGQEVDVQVLEVDPKRKRVSLSLKALKEKPEDPRETAESEPIKRQRDVDSLVGGMGQPTGGQLFGDPNKFGG